VPRPSHPALNVRDDREAPPLASTGHDKKSRQITQMQSRYFSREDWTTQISLKEFAKFDFWRGEFWFVRTAWEAIMNADSPVGQAHVSTLRWRFSLHATDSTR
jgi:hypothetical protein